MRKEKKRGRTGKSGGHAGEIRCSEGRGLGVFALHTCSSVSGSQ